MARVEVDLPDTLEAQYVTPRPDFGDGPARPENGSVDIFFGGHLVTTVPAVRAPRTHYDTAQDDQDMRSVAAETVTDLLRKVFAPHAVTA